MYVSGAAILVVFPKLLFADGSMFLALTGSKMVSDMNICTGRDRKASILIVISQRPADSPLQQIENTPARLLS